MMAWTKGVSRAYMLAGSIATLPTADAPVVVDVQDASGVGVHNAICLA